MGHAEKPRSIKAEKPRPVKAESHNLHCHLNELNAPTWQ